MPKNILIFSDGTGQIGGQRPDQRLSNVYKMYRAMRPGPSSPIDPAEQVAFYDPGLGAGETNGITFRRVRNALSAAVGTGIDDNVIDCYEAIIARYEPGDRVLLFGFSRGAYTVRSVANVMNLCGVPTRDKHGGPVPRHGPRLRKIASDAVLYVYNHGAGKDRKAYEEEREEKGRRFRKKYASNAEGDKANEQGNVQPTFIGVFDTVAALGNRYVNIAVYTAFWSLVTIALFGFARDWTLWLMLPLYGLILLVFYWWLVLAKSQFKYFSPDPEKPLRFSNPWDWPTIWRNGHRAIWSRRQYDRYLDSDVGFARHAQAIDESRKDFPRVGWATQEEYAKGSARAAPRAWLSQVWFAGNHSDVGGSYPEDESRLSDIALRWMIEELEDCVPEVRIRKELLVTRPDPTGLQHDEITATKWKWKVWSWPRKERDIPEGARLHPTVLERFEAGEVPQMGEVMLYRPNGLRGHRRMSRFYGSRSGEDETRTASE